MNVDPIKNNAKDVARLLKALSNERRLIIVCVLCDQEKCVGELEKIVNLSQSALSQHLARLRRDGIVKTRRDAQTIYYSLACQSTKSLLERLGHIFCD